MYSTYIKEFDKNVALLDEQCKKNAGFASVVKDFEVLQPFVRYILFCVSLAVVILRKALQTILQFVGVLIVLGFLLQFWLETQQEVERSEFRFCEVPSDFGYCEI